MGRAAGAAPPGADDAARPPSSTRTCCPAHRTAEPVPRLRRVPPGRSGRLWLQHRLAVAGRGAALLDQKLRILRAEVRRATLAAEDTAQAWTAAAEEAERWLVRASLLGGERAARLASDGVEAQVEVAWASTMGVRHPRGATCVLPPPADLPMGGAALVRPGRPTCGRSTRRCSTRSPRPPYACSGRGGRDPPAAPRDRGRAGCRCWRARCGPPSSGSRSRSTPTGCGSVGPGPSRSSPSPATSDDRHQRQGGQIAPMLLAT